MKIKTGRGNITLQKLMAIYSISMVISLPGLAISPILGKLESIFSSTSELQLQMLESLPSFIIVPFILLAGRMSLYFNTKKLLISGLAIFFACSIAYPFVNRMWALLLISGLLGIGAGLVIPFSTGLVAGYFSGAYRTKQLGYVSAVTNLTLVVATLLAGFLAGISWHLSFIVYCISGISLFFAFYLDETPPFYTAPAQPTTPTQPTTTLHHKKYNWLIKLMLFYYTATFLVLTIPLNLSLYMHNLKLGNYDISGTLISVFFLSMTLPGLLINHIIALLKAYTNSTAIALLTVGLIFFVFKAGMFLLTLGVILAGLGYGIIQPIIYDKTASRVKPSKATFVLSLVMVMNYIAIITYPFILQGIKSLFSADSAYFPFILSTIIACCFSIFAFSRHHSETFS